MKWMVFDQMLNGRAEGRSNIRSDDSSGEPLLHFKNQ